MSMRSGVEDMVRRKLREEYAMKNVEMQSLNKVRDELNAGQSQLKRAIETIDRETEGIDRYVTKGQGCDYIFCLYRDFRVVHQK